MEGLIPLEALLRQAEAAGLSLRLEGDELLVRGPRSSELLARQILVRKEEASGFLRAQRAGPQASEGPTSLQEFPARVVWERAVQEVAAAWTERATRERQAGLEPPWLDEETDLQLQAAVRSAIVAADLPPALEAIERWRSTWLELIEKPDSMADTVLDEIEGLHPPPNSTVVAMLNDARRQHGYRWAEEHGITAWLRRRAPEIATSWPTAPLTASWLDWRQRLGPEQVAALDEAFMAVTGVALVTRATSQAGGIRE